MGRFLALVLAVLAGVVAIFSIWANGELLDTGSWTSVSGRLLESRSVRHRVAAFLGEELTAQTETQLLAAGQEEIAEEVVPRLRREQVELAEKVMTTTRFKRIWEQANRSGQRELVGVLDEEDAGEHGAVVVDLTPALRQLADQLEDEGFAREFGISGLADLVEPGAARIEILEAQELGQAQDVVRVVRHLTLPAVLAAIILYALVLFLGRRQLRGTFVGVGIALLATGALALLARALAGHEIVDQLLTQEADRDAAEAAWRIATSTISDLAVGAIVVGALTAVLAAVAPAIFRVSRGREPA
jgi:hypothetical protein